jgi:hypothetical protein
MASPAADHVARVMELSPKQLAEQQYWGHVDHVLSTGGRGGGKSTGMIFSCLRHCDELGPLANPVVTREGWGDLTELFSRVAEYAYRIWGSVDTNKNEGTIRTPAGACINFTNLGDEQAYARAHGKNFTALFADEVGNYSPTAYAYLTRLRTNIRVPSGVRAIEWWTANPYGRSHGPIYKNYICKSPFWRPYQDAAGRWCVNTFSNYRDNNAIDQEAYRRQLAAGCPDPALLQAWLEGTWSPIGGQLFQFDPGVHVLAQQPRCVNYRLGGDWGAAAPAVCILLGEVAPGTPGFGNGALVALEEIDTAEDPNDLSVGNGMVPVAFAEMVVERCLSYGYKHPSGVMDDARGLLGDTVIDMMRSGGVNMRKPFKRDRVGGWNLVNQRLVAAKPGGEGPTLHISNRCPHLIETIAEAPRGTLRPEDVDPKYTKDHWIDALSYGLKDFYGGKVGSGRAVGIV